MLRVISILVINDYVNSGSLIDICLDWTTVDSFLQKLKKIFAFVAVCSGDRWPTQSFLKRFYSQRDATIIKDECFIDARSEIIEGVFIKK